MIQELNRQLNQFTVHEYQFRVSILSPNKNLFTSQSQKWPLPPQNFTSRKQVDSGLAYLAIYPGPMLHVGQLINYIPCKNSLVDATQASPAKNSS